MIRILLILLVVSLSLPSEASKKKKEYVLTAEDKTEIQYAEERGLELYNAYLAKNGSEEITARESEILEMSKKVLCEGKYTAVTINDEKRGIENIYFLLLPKDNKAIQFGRHINAKFSLGTNNIINIDLSTKSCIAVPSDENSMPYVTHILSKTPTEFHVFLNLYYKKNMFIGTEIGSWKIEDGKVSQINDLK